MAAAPHHVSAQLTPDVLTSIKKATVLINVIDNGKPIASGTGFVVDDAPQGFLVATNAHVVGGATEIGDSRRVICILHPGEAEQIERLVEIQVLASLDDVAIFRCATVPGVKALPLADEVPHETQRVYVAGFPFGQLLSSRTETPNVTISETSVSSIRRGVLGEYPEFIQTAGGIDPGNSGGPVVNAAGEVVAVAVAKVQNSQIGLAIPAWKIADLMPPSMFDPHLSMGPGGRMAQVGQSEPSYAGTLAMPELHAVPPSSPSIAANAP